MRWGRQAVRLAVLFVAIIAAEAGKAVSKETKIDILVTPVVTTLVGIGAAWVIAPPIGFVASAFGQVIMQATELQPFLMGVVVSVLVGVALTLPHFLCRYLFCSWSDRACWRGGCGRMLRADGWLCSHEFQRERLGRTGEPGTWHIYAADAKYR